MAKTDLKKSIRGLNFLTRLGIFGTKMKSGDQNIFDTRGAIRITDKEIKKRNGEIVKIRGISDSGTGLGSGVDSMAIHKPSGGQAVDPAKAMDKYYGWVYACVNAIASEIANNELRVYQIGKDGKHEELLEHELLDFLDAVNDFQTAPEFKHTMAAHLELAGNAYILLEGVKKYTDKPTAMFLLNPGSMRVILDKTTYPFKIIKYQYTVESRKFNYEPYEIIQLKYPNPSNPYVGLGTVAAIAEWIDNDNSITEFLRQFFRNGAQIGVTFETDMVAEDQLQELRDSFNEQHAGTQNAYKGMFLPKGVKKPSNDIKFSDIGMKDLSDNTRDKILAGTRVSKTILGTAESDTNRSTAETADYVFAKRTIKPKMQLIVSYLNEFLTPRFGDDIYISFIDPVPEDKAARNTEMTTAVGKLPVITANEAREQFMGLGPVEGGEKLMMPNNFQVATSTTSAVAEPAEPKSARRLGYVGRGGSSKTQFARSFTARQMIDKTLIEKISDIMAKTRKKTVQEMSNHEYETVVLKDKAERVSKYSDEMMKKVQDMNARQKAEVLANLERSIKRIEAFNGIENMGKAVDPKKLLDVKGWIKIMIDLLTPTAKAAFLAESAHALDLIGAPGIDVANSPAAQAAVARAMDLMATSYNESVVSMLTEKINAGLEAGESVQSLAQSISDIYEFQDQISAGRVAVTESNRIANDANKIAWKQSGVVKQVEWVTSERDNVCPFCDAQQGKTISIDDNFFDKGDTITGTDDMDMTADYSDIGGPPLHVNCNCSIKPIVS